LIALGSPGRNVETGRAYALEAGIPVVPVVAKLNPDHKGGSTPTHADAIAKARSAYQDFFALWKDADPDIPLLVQARMESFVIAHVCGRIAG
jgi:hypothetical protein